MSNLHGLVKKYSIEKQHKIKKICEPLKTCLGIPYFSYYSIAKYFKREANTLIGKSKSDGYNLREARGEAFFTTENSLPLLNQDKDVQKFLKLLEPLSARERECLDLFKKGHSAQATAALLGLSQRTIEHYFENIKNKLGCQSKWDLLDW